LLPLVYEELRKLAAQRMANEAPGQTIQATALVHEAHMRLVGPEDSQVRRWDSRGYFFAAAAEAMRRILIDRARAKGALKRGGDPRRLQLDQDPLASDELSAELAARSRPTECVPPIDTGTFLLPGKVRLAMAGSRSGRCSAITNQCIT